MSMTRAEAIKELQSYAEASWGGLNEAFNLALTALRGPTREQVERMFPGCALCNWGGLDYVGVDSDGIYLSKPSKNEKFRFCPVCGKPLTDEAVEMVMERMNKLHD